MSESTELRGPGGASAQSPGTTRAREKPGRTGKRKRYTSERSRAEAKLGLMLAAPAAIVLLLVTGYPILQAVYQSFFNLRLTDRENAYFNWGANYVTVLSDPLWWQTLGFTLLITVVTVAVELVLGFFFAMVMLNAMKGVRGPIRTIILVPYGIITVVAAFSWKYAFDLGTGFVGTWFGIEGFDWFGNFWSSFAVISLAEIWKTTPFISLLMLAGLAQIPGDMVEAATVDGASWWQRLTRVILPNMKSAIMVALMFRTLEAFRIFDSVFVMTQGANGTATVSSLAYDQTISQLQTGLGSAVSVLLFLCVGLICLLFIKGLYLNLGDSRG
ncbi:carbohydrate ABC transporter permease [uncultured Brevibacterium sp.]|uniref:carbohydrate ABC transporter permease n=1 Tax=uncultured Brevibacterium sp. TaxID=189678 RepID=UPI0025FCE670|nr:sugar ABC transporter permease [uncultured Brevibacterium sp.]